jgi:hypothetical protein
MMMIYILMYLIVGFLYAYFMIGFDIFFQEAYEETYAHKNFDKLNEKGLVKAVVVMSSCLSAFINILLWPVLGFVTLSMLYRKD